MSEERIAYLLPLFMNDSCSPLEKKEFLQLVNLSSNDEYLLNLLEKTWQQYISTVHLDDERSERNFNDILSKAKPPVPYRFINVAWFKYAAVLLIAIATACFFYFNNNYHPDSLTKADNKQQHPGENNKAAPKVVHAVITTESGRQIILDDTKNGTSIDNFRKVSDDNVTYSALKNTAIEYHTLSVPRGSKIITLTLSDTSKVWLNAGSSITYPTAFTGNKRIVKIKGEAYFEITHLAKTPFIVEKDDAFVQVLGTHFNINAYDDEGNMKVTLISGSVKVSRAGQTATLTQGQQAELTTNGAIRLNKNVNLDEVLAWKMGRFVFNDTDIKTIMRQVMKWYDVEVSYEGNVQERSFTADISRTTNLSELLKVFELSNIKFHLEGNKLIVKL